MQAYIALLRGINVSGQKKIKMADLKVLFQHLGFSEIQTYIQSGNVVFYADQEDKHLLADHIKTAIQKHYGFDVPVTVLSRNEFFSVHNNIPLGNFNVDDINENGTKIYISFLSSKPENDMINKLLSYVVSPEKLIIEDKFAYLYCPNGYGKSKLSNNFIENKLKVSATTRNWKTVVKIHEMMNMKEPV
ncbi:MAG: DUF1697 domain-containing protein [Colwellia sp.]|nr:DUF1697 domain-containing protein [Colwellia sp.]